MVDATTDPWSREELTRRVVQTLRHAAIAVRAAVEQDRRAEGTRLMIISTREPRHGQPR